MRCPRCTAQLREAARFCDQCGRSLEPGLPGVAAEEVPPERKYVTTLFSDLSGYTSLTEKLDPEEVREIMSRIFGETAQILSRYEGFIERFIGDAVMAIFGIPRAHEDDAVRAVRAAQEIHEVVAAMNPELQPKIGQPLSMHTGINTGIVVTAEVNLNKGTHGTTGVSINLASRLSTLAKPGEILVGKETWRQAEGYFSFQELAPVQFKGKSEPARVFRLISAKDEPVMRHRQSGLRARLIGRGEELDGLMQAAGAVRREKCAVVFVTGEAGTGKSRLVEEFRNAIAGEEIRWWEAHAFSFTGNTPYSLLIDLLTRVFRIEEGDGPEAVRTKIDRFMDRLSGDRRTLAPYLGSLFGLQYPELETLSPELWKIRLQSALKQILAALTQNTPSVLLFEDIHLADSSSICLLRSVLAEPWKSTLFICVYRPHFRLFSSRHLAHLPFDVRNIHLQPLSPTDVQCMIESMLNASPLPEGLPNFAEKKVEGNPFYLEELINSMVEDGTLIEEDAGWRLSRPLKQANVPTTINGVISARIDRLERASRKVLQEASVIGRSFLYDILLEMTELSDPAALSRALLVLEEAKLIYERSEQPDRIYMFKHAMTQEVAYGRLLRKERQKIHRRIGAVIERLFPDRLSEFYETLAFHFQRAGVVPRTVDYMLKSGEKTLERFAVEESHRYFQEAYDLLSVQAPPEKRERSRLVDLLNRWSAVYYYRSDFKGLTERLEANRHLADALPERSAQGTYYKWLGFAHWGGEQYDDAYRHLNRSLEVGEADGDVRVMGEAHSWLTWTCAEMGRLAEAIEHGKKAQALSAALSGDHDIYFLATSGMGHAYWYEGDRKRSLDAGESLLRHGEKHSNFRSFVEGYHIVGWSHFIAGDFKRAIDCFRKAVEKAAFPYYSLFPKVGLGLSLLWDGRVEETEQVLAELLHDSRGLGVAMLEAPAKALSGLVKIGRGELAEGIRTLEGVKSAWERKKRRYPNATAEYVLGRVYLELALRRTSLPVSKVFRNAVFLTRTLPKARKKAERHFQRALQIAGEIGAKGLMGQTLLDLGLLYGLKKEPGRARDCIAEAISLFDACGAECRLAEAKQAIAPFIS